MKMKLGHWWQSTRSSFWFVPALIVLGAIALASALIAVDATGDLKVVQKLPMLFGAGAAGARGLLSVVAGSMVTVAGVVFSITLVALSLTSSQYTSRVLRNFMSDRINQVVLGVFVGIFAYCLVVLRTIRGGDEGAFVPSLAVLGALILAFVGIAFLIYFIHHIAIAIQASSIIAAAAAETLATVNRLFPEDLTVDAGESDASDIASHPELTWMAVPSRRSGYVESIDESSLLKVAEQCGCVLRMERGIGEFVAEGMPLVSVAGAVGLDEKTPAMLRDIYVIRRQRTLRQDAGFGIRQIVDIAMRALSPGINDSTTAAMCVDYLGAILARLASRRISASGRVDDGKLRVITRGPRFERLLGEAFDQIRLNAEGNLAILLGQLRALETVALMTANLRRREAIRGQVDLIGAAARRAVVSQHDGAEVEALLMRLSIG
ncbi:MAG: DUF2254 domain-containing protein [Acidobacteriota bacterium]|nr:DUF2254 domain-containing protein [Acidobacteriota bacterium]